MHICFLLAAAVLFVPFSEAFAFIGGNGNGFSGGRLPPGLSSSLSPTIPPNMPLANAPLSLSANLTYSPVPSESILSINTSSIIDQVKRHSSMALQQIVDITSLWWRRLIVVQKQMWVVLAPKVYKQFLLLKAGVPFCLDRTMQYMQPLNLCLLLALSQWRALSVMKYVVKGVAITSFVQMIRDSIKAGSAWMPAVAHPDSYALITGATSGLGKAMAAQLYARGYNLILVSRNYTSLEDVRNEFYNEQVVHVESIGPPRKDSLTQGDDTDQGSSPTTSTSPTDVDASRSRGPRVYPPNIEIVAADFSDPMAPFQVLRELKILGVENKVDILVANAGKGHYGTVHRTALAEIRDQLEVNVASTVSLIRLMTPRMILRRQQLKASLALQNGIQAIHKERHRHEGVGGGRIVVVSSIAGAGPGADIAVYSAAKSFLTTFALSIRRELLSEGIMVTVAQPGPLSGTHFLTKLRHTMTHVPAAFSMPFLVVRAEDAAREILRAMYLGREMVAPGLFTKVNLHIVSKLLPPSVYSASVQRMWRPLPRWQSLLPRWFSPKMKKKERKTAAGMFGDGGGSGAGQGSSSDDPSQQQLHRRHRRRSSSENRRKIVWTSPGTYFTALQAWYEALTSGDFLLDPEDQAALQRRQHPPYHRRHRLGHRRRLFPWSSEKEDDVDVDDDGFGGEADATEDNDDDPYRAADRYLQASEAQEEATMLYKQFPFETVPQSPSITVKPDFPSSSSSLAEAEGEIDDDDEEEGQEADRQADSSNVTPSETGMSLFIPPPPLSPEDEGPVTIPPLPTVTREDTP